VRRPLATLAALALVACTEARQVGRRVEQSLNPFASSRVSLLSVERVGPYLMTEFRSGSALLTFFAPAADEACAQLLRPEATVTYRKHGNFGRFEDDELRCDPIGVGSLAAWRDRRPRDTRDASILPRAHASFRELERDNGMALVRGRFPLASRVGIPSGFDLVAILPVSPPCERPISRGSGALEFLPAGNTAFRIVGEGAPCPVLGFAFPPAASG
jgi:hypothetical protein